VTEREGRGVLLHSDEEPKIQGHLTIGEKQYWIYGERVSAIRTNLKIQEAGNDDERSSQSGERKQDIVRG
jgi:hypothetical protein